MPGGLPPAPAAAPRRRACDAAPLRAPILRPGSSSGCGKILPQRGRGGARITFLGIRWGEQDAAMWHTACSKRSQSTREHLRGRFCSPNLFPTLTHEISDLHPSPHLPASPNHRGKAKPANPRPEPPSYPTQVRQHNDLDSGAAPFTGGRGAFGRGERRAAGGRHGAARLAPPLRHAPCAETVARRPPPWARWPIWQTPGLPRWHIGRDRAVTARCPGAGRADPRESAPRTGRSRRAGASSPPPRDRAGSASPPSAGAPSARPASAGPVGPAG